MTDNRLTINQLRMILQEAAGDAGYSGPDGGFEDTEFDDLGYDSISLLEAAGRIERDRGVKLDDDVIVTARTLDPGPEKPGQRRPRRDEDSGPASRPAV